MEEAGLPFLDCLLQNTLRTICSFPNSASSSSKWVYAVFWRIVPRNFPPPRWELGGTALDRSKGNKRNWILVWEDGFCDFNECEQQGRSGYVKDRFGADVFFKMSHEVYSYGEGLVGKVAAENGHKWVSSDTQNGNETSYLGSWNASNYHQPRTWEFQLNSGIQTIAVIAVREGLVQLGSFNKIAEDLNLVLNIQRKFSYLHSIPGVFSIQRPPYLPTHHHHHQYITKPNFQMMETNEMTHSTNNLNRVNGMHNDERSSFFSMIAINLGRNNNSSSAQNYGTSPIWSGPPSLPNMSCSLGALLSKLPSVNPNQVHDIEINRIKTSGMKVKVEDNKFHVDDDEDHKGKAGWS